MKKRLLSLLGLFSGIALGFCGDPPSSPPVPPLGGSIAPGPIGGQMAPGPVAGSINPGSFIGPPPIVGAPFNNTPVGSLPSRANGIVVNPALVGAQATSPPVRNAPGTTVNSSGTVVGPSSAVIVAGGARTVPGAVVGSGGVGMVPQSVIVSGGGSLPAGVFTNGAAITPYQPVIVTGGSAH